MKYEKLSRKNRKLLKEITKPKDVFWNVTKREYPNHTESDIIELLDLGYVRLGDTQKGHLRTNDNNWIFIITPTYKGYHYTRGRIIEIFKLFGNLGGWIALVNFIISTLEKIF
jgi:hypothetical protein